MNAVLSKAFELERKGLEFYINTAVKSNNALVRRAIFSLAKEEISHMMKIDEVSISLDAAGEWIGEEAAARGSRVEAEIKIFFDNADKKILSENRDDAAVIKEAMELERKSYELYDDLGRKAASDTEKRFYGELKAQEEGHFDALQNVHYYLTKTGDWFEKDEGNVWSWMNL